MIEDPTKPLKDLLDKIATDAADKGNVIAMGFAALKAAIIPPTASVGQISDMRIAYYSSAQHLMATIMAVLSPESEPTDEDFARLDGIMKELEAFTVEMQAELAARKH